MKKTGEKNYKNEFEKVVINSGVGRLAVNTPGFEDKLLPELMKEFAAVTAQKGMTRPAKKSIAGFKMREGNIVGIKATLRGKRMVDFLNRIIKIVLPRLRDFRGINIKNVDANGNLSIGLRDHVVFPEINQENSRAAFGVEITVVPKVQNRASAIEIYRELGVPFQR